MNRNHKASRHRGQYVQPFFQFSKSDKDDDDDVSAVSAGGEGMRRLVDVNRERKQLCLDVVDRLAQERNLFQNVFFRVQEMVIEDKIAEAIDRFTRSVVSVVCPGFRDDT